MDVNILTIIDMKDNLHLTQGNKGNTKFCWVLLAFKASGCLCTTNTN